MNFEEFKRELESNLVELKIKINQKQEKKLFDYMKIVLEWNQRINLTAITDEKEFIIKHIVDSLAVSKYIKDDSKIVDVGTGAGLPGIPLKIINDSLKVTLLDSLNKRINFLNEVIQKLELNKIETVHARVEDFGQNAKYREQYDISIARAVAPLNVLCEYLIPLTKTKGKVICMKSLKSEEEIKESKKALEVLNGTIIINDQFVLPKTDIARNIIIIEKIKKTIKTFPRKAGTPSKAPIS